MVPKTCDQLAFIEALYFFVELSIQIAYTFHTLIKRKVILCAVLIGISGYIDVSSHVVFFPGATSVAAASLTETQTPSGDKIPTLTASRETLVPFSASTPQKIKSIRTAARTADKKSVSVSKSAPKPHHSFRVPFFSQFTDITSAKWKKVGCGVTSLAMLVEYYKPGSASVDTLLNQGIKSGAYLEDAGWTYGGLIHIAEKYGLSGTTHDFGDDTMNHALSALQTDLKNGPVMASVHYTFDPRNPIPHLVVINSIEGDTVRYNDPAAKSGGKSISKTLFMKAWKKRYIEIRPNV